MAITLQTWRDAIISTLKAQFTALSLPYGDIGEWDPADLLDDNGVPIIKTPAIVLYRGPLRINASPMIQGPCYLSTQYQWHAYCIASARSADRWLAADEIANALRAILFSHGNTWGLSPQDLWPIEQADPIEGEPIDIRLAGHACRVLRWQQAARLATTPT
jgi:hypothetical protein